MMGGAQIEVYLQCKSFGSRNLLLPQCLSERLPSHALQMATPQLIYEINTHKTLEIL